MMTEEKFVFDFLENLVRGKILTETKFDIVRLGVAAIVVRNPNKKEDKKALLIRIIKSGGDPTVIVTGRLIEEDNDEMWYTNIKKFHPEWHDSYKGFHIFPPDTEDCDYNEEYKYDYQDIMKYMEFLS